MCRLPDHQPPNPARLDLQRGAESSAPNPAAPVHAAPAPHSTYPELSSWENLIMQLPGDALPSLV